MTWTAGEILTATNLTTYLPQESTDASSATVANLTKGDGTEVFRHARLGPLAWVYWKFTFGATSAVTGDIQVTLPVNSAVQRFVGAGYFEDVSTAARFDAAVLQAASSSVLLVRAKDASGTYLAANTNLSSTIPFTWATGDVIVVNALYVISV